MAGLAVWQRTIVDEEGNVVPGAEVEVRREEDGSLATLYADRAGETPLANPLAADMSGFVRFFVQGGAYTITAVGAGSTRTWRFDPTGRLQEFDRVSEALAIADGADTLETRRQLGEFATVADVENANIPPVLESIRTEGYYSPGDGGAALYKRVVSEPSHAGKIQSADGAWWEIADRRNLNARSLGVKGDGSNELAAIQACIDAALPGGTIYFPAGDYGAPQNPDDEDSGYVIVEKDGLRLVGDGNATVFHFGIKVRGKVSAPVNVGAAFGTGDTTVTLASSLGVDAQDWIQLWGVCHPYSEDAGDYQLGSYNPTNEVLPQVRFTEFLQVLDASDPLALKTTTEVLFPKYQDSTTGLTTTIPGVGSAQVVKVDFVQGFTMENLRCEADYNSFDHYQFTYVKGVRVRNVTFHVANESNGRWLRFNACLDGIVDDCRLTRDTSTAGGSSWNSIMVSGSTDVTVMSCTFHDEAQCVDFIATLPSSELPTGFVAGGMTHINGAILNCTFMNCHDAGTTHPGGFGFRYQGNTVYGGGGGLRTRIRNNVITGNRFTTPGQCLAFGGFYDDSLVAANQFLRPAGHTGTWTAIHFVNFGSETNNRNRTRAVVVANNSIVSKDPGAIGVNFRQIGNGINPTSGIEMTDEEKAAESQIIIRDNVMVNAGIYGGRFFNGIEVYDNQIFGAPHEASIYLQDRTGGWTIVGNYLEDNTIRLPAAQPSHLAWGRFRIANNTSPAGVELQNRGVGLEGAYLTSSGNLRYYDDLEFGNGRGIRAFREEGETRLRLDAQPGDETSQSIVEVFAQSQTSAYKRFLVHGRSEFSEVIYPMNDAGPNLGRPTHRWAVVYASSGTINTSDAREKQQVSDLSEAERAVAQELKGLVRKFKWNSAVDKKGDGARWHFGVMAQEVQDVFSSHGLDAHEYGLFCYDEWEEQPEVIDEESGTVLEAYSPAGNRYGIRYDELLAFIVAAT